MSANVQLLTLKILEQLLNYTIHASGAPTPHTTDSLLKEIKQVREELEISKNIPLSNGMGMKTLAINRDSLDDKSLLAVYNDEMWKQFSILNEGMGILYIRGKEDQLQNFVRIYKPEIIFWSSK